MKKPSRAIAAKPGKRRKMARTRPKAGAARSAKPPARRLAGVAKAMTKANAGAMAAASTTSTRTVTLARHKASIRALQAELARAQRRIEALEATAATDFLLDIPNRRGFERELERALAYIKRYHGSGALIVLDVDGLKPINDAFGHAAGDDVLKAIAATLKRQVRSSDVVARLGGDEFAVLVWNLAETDAKAKAAALEQATDALSFAFGGDNVRAGASAGVAMLGPHAQAERALEEADATMYVRKAQRRHENAATAASLSSIRAR